MASHSRTDLVSAWRIVAETAPDAHLVCRWARYAPFVSWRAILAILRHPRAAAQSRGLARELADLLSRHGHSLIDIIEAETARNTVLQECLKRVISFPQAPIPREIQFRLSRIVGAPVGQPAGRHVDKLYEETPDLKAMLEFEPRGWEEAELPELDEPEVERIADAWVRYEECFWAHDEVQRFGWNHSPEDRWHLIVELADGASEDSLAALGVGPLEDLLVSDGPAIIGSIELAAANSAAWRYCISHVWPPRIDAGVWARLVTARQDEPQRG